MILQVLGGPLSHLLQSSSFPLMATKASILESSLLGGALGSALTPLSPPAPPSGVAGVAMMRKREEKSHIRLAWMVTNLWLLGICHRLSQPAIIRGAPPHWVKEPHQELAPALMVVAGSFLPPPHQGLLLPRSLLLTSSLCREFGGSSLPATSILPFSSSLDGQLVHHLHLHPHHLRHLLQVWVLAKQIFAQKIFTPKIFT